MRYLGLDVGARRIGLAFGELPGAMAVPAGVHQRTGSPADEQAILKEARSREADVIVVGMPYLMDGSVGPQAQLVEGFIAQLRAVAGSIQVVTWDERLTSFEADRILRSAPGSQPGKRQGKQRRSVQDAVAAAVMLQSFLDAQRSPRLSRVRETGESMGQE